MRAVGLGGTGLVEGPMDYERFEHLLMLKFALVRRLHETPPSQRPPLKRAMVEIDERIACCDRYDDYIREYASRVRKVG